MTALSTHTAVPAGRSATGLDRLFARVAIWNNNRQTRRALSKLTARELDDIGLERSDIDRLF